MCVRFGSQTKENKEEEASENEKNHEHLCKLIATVFSVVSDTKHCMHARMRSYSSDK